MECSRSFTFLKLAVALLLLFFLASSASANHFHYISITDTRFPANDPDDPAYDPDFLLFDAIGDAPIEEWITYTGLDEDITISNQGHTYYDANGDAAAQGVFDFPGFEDITDAQATMLIEVEVTVLDAQAGKTIEVGFTDLVNRIRWEESEQTLSTNVLPATDDVLGLPRWPSAPFRLRAYYNYDDFVLTFVLIDDAAGTSQQFSLQGSAQPFLNFFGDGVPGTDPDNRDIYFYTLCESQCGLTVTDWKVLKCDTVGGEVDVDNCLLYPGVGNGQLDPGETCDDGNTVSGDGCDENGLLEKTGRKCQEAIAVAGQKYSTFRLKALQRCRNGLNRGKALFQDKDKTLAITDRSACASEFRTATKLAQAAARARKSIARKCTDQLVGALAMCGDTVGEVVSADGSSGCLIQTHDTSVDLQLTAQYGG